MRKRPSIGLSSFNSARDIDAVGEDSPVVGLDEVEDETQKSGLASAIVADEPHQLTAVDFKGWNIKGDLVAVDLAEVFYFEVHCK